MNKIHELCVWQLKHHNISSQEKYWHLEKHPDVEKTTIFKNVSNIH